MFCPHLRLLNPDLSSCALQGPNVWHNRRGMPCPKCLETTKGVYPTDPIPTVHQIELPQVRPSDLQTVSGPEVRPVCFYRSSQPIDRGDCNCPDKWVYQCGHTQRGGTCTAADCQTCPLFEPE